MPASNSFILSLDMKAAIHFKGSFCPLQRFKDLQASETARYQLYRASPDKKQPQQHQRHLVLNTIIRDSHPMTTNLTTICLLDFHSDIHHRILLECTQIRHHQRTSGTSCKNELKAPEYEGTFCQQDKKSYLTLL